MQSDTNTEARELIRNRNRNLYLSFQVGAEEFAAPALAVREVLEYKDPRRVPRMPEYIAGVLNLRGVVIPVIDLGTLLAGTPTKIDRRTCTAILEAQSPGGRQLTVGCIVDRVNEVLNIEDEQIDAAPSFGPRIDTRFMQGVARVSDERVVILLESSAMGDFEELERLAQSNQDLFESASSAEAPEKSHAIEAIGQAYESGDADESAEATDDAAKKD